MLISLAAVIGVYAAELTLGEVLIKRALRDEEQHFWRRQAAQRDFPAPDTRNLTGYLLGADGAGAVPAALAGLEPGFHRPPSEADYSLVLVSERAGGRLFLVFDGERVGEIALFFGLLPLAGVLVALYLSAWLTYRLARHAISPVLSLARRVRHLDPEQPGAVSFAVDTLPGNPDSDVVALSGALENLSQRINEFIERERNFTRDASHELRSPLTVIRLAADMLLSEQELAHPARNSVLRIKRAASDVEELTEAFLLLARESSQGLATARVCLNDVVDEELERAAPARAGKPVAVERDEPQRLEVEASDKVLSVLVGNLVRNAFSYTDAGVVRIRIDADRLVIEDSGVGMSDDELAQAFSPFYRAGDSRRGGHGVGLTIVRRLSERFGWPVHISSTPGVGTRVVVEFPAVDGAETAPSA